MFYLQSRSTWSTLPRNESLARHGEKLSAPTIQNLDLEAISHWVNPKEVFLRQITPALSPLWNQIEIKPEESHLDCGAEKILEMEEFVDLSRYFLQDKSKVQCLNTVDELNTPIIDLRNPFDFNQRHYTTITQQNIDHTYNINIKREFDPVNNDIIPNDLRLLKSAKEEDLDEIIKDSVVNSDNKQSTETIMWSADAQNDTTRDVSNPEAILSNTNITMEYTILGETEEDLFTVNSFSDVLNMKTSEDQMVNTFNVPDTNSQVLELKYLAYDTPDDSNCSSNDSSKSSKLKVNLEVANSKLKEEPIKTSDIFQTIEEMEVEKGFNILQYINDEEFQLATNALMDQTNQPNIVFQATEIEPSELFINSPQSSSNSINTKQIHLAKKQRKRKYSDDEEYLPPSKIKQAKTSKLVYIDSSDDDDDEEPVTKVVRRGRPPKRNVSISSDDYGDTPEAKYRELRDKNNEASRRSRLKRKLKEMEYGKEADELERDNQKLRVQVEELEKTVTSFRNNLMLLLLNKK